ncbi:alkaline phosphatase family protein [Novosphingobium sp. TH158]|uniref:alkaline phosphatase family protein n=1 Tax=Novosphingobium sp. TH158 TaxID=2067455 RepID=UPI000C7B1CD5|nr:alkaline phosphatase family protein [Novosphingobium sp. TH158]PLK27662.1 alkaline phosphatase [Novosphingobium sp. TH158]
MRLRAFAAVSALIATPALAADEPAAAAPPRLIVAVSVDQLSADLFAQYRRNFTGGLARLQDGAVFPSAYQGHAATETCPGHSTLLTGVRPGRNGIIANHWFDLSLPRAEKRIYCSEDASDPESGPDKPVVSPRLLKVPTLGEWMKRKWPASRNVAVSGKDRAVAMMGGHKIDQGYWWKGSGFTTYKGAQLSPVVEAENALIAKAIAKGSKAFAAPAWCAPRDRAVRLGKDFEIGQGRFPAPAKDVTAFSRSPRLDAATLSLAGRLVDEMKLGRGDAPDLISVSLSATDYIGHSVGNEGVEMCIQLAELDRGLGAFFARLDKARIDYAVVLTADHGGVDATERLAQQALPRAVRVDPALMPGALGRAIAAELGITGVQPLIYGDGPAGDMYLNRALTPSQKSRALDALVSRLRAHPQVAAAYAAGELAATPMPVGSPQDWNLRDRARASFDPERSGDVVVLLDRAVMPIAVPGKGYTATHGSPWDYDRRVPLMFWRKGINGFEQPAPVETVDIAPTLSALLRLKVPDGSFDGRCLDIDGAAGNTCR